MIRSGSGTTTWTLLAALALAGPASAGEPAKKPALWNEMPLPLPVRTPQDLAFKQVAERSYLVFNLLAAGKLAWDAGRYAEAADQWETLLTLPELEADIDRTVRPLAIEARRKAGQESTLAAESPPPPVREVKPAPARRKSAAAAVDVIGRISGGGRQGPGGAVVALRRADGRTPAPSPSGEYLLTQRGKTFLPHVLAVPAGATVSFRNEDAVYHNVFSPTAPGEFDLGLYKAGLARTQKFTRPGAVQVFCNIHAQMSAWVVVLDTPWYAVADATGGFQLRGVPPGRWNVEVWHEASSKSTAATITVGDGMAPLALAVGGDRQPAAFPPDKYGKPRQVQLGY